MAKTDAEQKIEKIRITKDIYFADIGEEFDVHYEHGCPFIEYVSNWLDAGNMKTKDLHEMEGSYEIVSYKPSKNLARAIVDAVVEVKGG